MAASKGDDRTRARRAPRPVSSDEEMLVQNLADAAESFASIDAADLNPLLERIGSARIVLLGEATHGTSEFYRMRERISRDLIVKKGFRFVAIEADWPDAAQSITTCGISGIRPPSGRLLPGSRPGCGGTSRCAISSAGSANTTAQSNATSASLSWPRSR